MKKILPGSSLLFILCFLLIVFQLSCSKSEANVGESKAQEEIQTDNNPDGGGGGNNNPSTILYLTMDFNTGDPELRSLKLDGTDDHQINLTLPPDWFLILQRTRAHVAQKEQRIIFTAFQFPEGGPAHQGFFSCKLDGSNLTLIKDIVLPENTGTQLYLEDVF